MIKKNSTNNTQLANYIASSKITGVDWRYELLHDYLRESPSYQLACRFMAANGRGRPKNAPTDWPAVLELYEDFGDVFRIREDEWWRTKGCDLYDIKIKDPRLLILGITDRNQIDFPIDQDAQVEWELMNRPNSLILAVPTTLTKKEALAQFAAIIKQQKFQTPTGLLAKYQLAKSKVQRNTLAVGVQALRAYKMDMPLWKIGYSFNLSVTSVKEIDQGKELPHNKAYLQVLASKLIHKAELIAENAARGRFPSDKAFPEAILISNKRKVGRPKKK